MPRMHDHEVDTDPALVRTLLAQQFPHWADLPIRRIDSSGTDHAIYRLGDDIAARLPLIHWATAQAEKEALWLPLLAPQLPVAIPTPLAMGEPGHGYPWRWAVHAWLPGANPGADTDLVALAEDAAALILAIREIDPGGRELPKASGGAALLRARDEAMQTRMLQLADEYDVAALSAAWARDFGAAQAWKGPRAIIHGDLSPGNLILTHGKLSGLIDFGFFGLGDPATDIRIAWSVFSGASRARFRDALGVDDDTWIRARAWALAHGVMALAYYRNTNPGICAVARRIIGEVLAD